MLIDCPPAIVLRYAAYDEAFSGRDAAALQAIETPDFRDTDPDGTVRELKGATKNQGRFFAMVNSMTLTSKVKCARVAEDRAEAWATMTMDAVYTPPGTRPRKLHQVYVNHDVWEKIDDQWRLASQTTTKLDGTDDGKEIHEKLCYTGGRSCQTRAL